MKLDKTFYIFTSLLLLCEIFFFRNILFNDLLIGDRADGRLTMLITEHWYRFCCGLEKINDLGIFYPAENTLAYSDMLLGYGIIHSFFRFCGLDMFISYKITLILIHLLGVFTLFYFLTKVLKLDYFWAFWGTSAFSFSCTYANQFAHTQLNAISFIPLFLIFLVKAIQNLDNPSQKNLYVYSAIFVVILILYTAWYIFFFSVLFIFVFIVVGLLFCYLKKIDIKNILNKFWHYDLIGYIILTVLLMIPFALAEIPIMKMSGGRTYNSVVSLIGIVYSYIYTSNSIFDVFFKPLSKFLPSIEIRMGFSLVLFIMFIVYTIFLFKNNKEELPVIYKILSITLIICLLLPIKLPFIGFSLWYFVYKFFIGSASIRAVGRFLFFLSLPMAIISSILGSLFWNIKKIDYKKYLFVMSILCVFLFVSNINTVGVSSNWCKKQEISFLNNLPSPPKNCKIFYVDHFYIYNENINWVNLALMNLDAYEIAYKFDLKTINGYSGVTPKDYKIYYSDIKKGFYNWILLNNLQDDIYLYDLRNKLWYKFENMYLSSFDASKKNITLCAGVWDLNPTVDYSWTDENVKIFLKSKNISKKGLYLKIGTVLGKYKKQFPNRDFEGSIFVNGEKVKNLQVINGISEYFVDVKPSKDDIYLVELKTNFYFNPRDLKDSNDSRNLSLKLFYVGEKN